MKIQNFKEYRLLITEQQQIEGTLRKEFPEVRLVVTETPRYFILQVMLIQEKRRGQGEAKAFMNRLIELHNKYEKDIYLSASDVYGGDKQKLARFYDSLGFKPNNNMKVKEDLVLEYEK